MLFTQNSPGVRLLLGSLQCSHQPATGIKQHWQQNREKCVGAGLLPASNKNIVQVRLPLPGNCCTSAGFLHGLTKSGQVSVNSALSIIPDSSACRAVICQHKQVQSCRTWAEHLALLVIPAHRHSILPSGSPSSLISCFPRIFPQKNTVWMVRFGSGSAGKQESSVRMSTGLGI